MISVVVPVYNESPCLQELYRRLNSVFEALDIDYEVIFVDDGSSDNSPEILEQLCAVDLHITTPYRSVKGFNVSLKPITDGRYRKIYLWGFVQGI